MNKPVMPSYPADRATIIASAVMMVIRSSLPAIQSEIEKLLRNEIEDLRRERAAARNELDDQ
jgi:hypothetical protein